MRRQHTVPVLLAIASATGSATAAPRYDFHGLLFTCGTYPPVNLDGKGGVYAYEADLTTSVTGKAVLGKDSVTVSFPRRFPAFTITETRQRFLRRQDAVRSR